MSEAITDQIKSAIVTALPDARVQVSMGGPGHFALVVNSGAFDGKSLLAKQRLVLSAIKDLMGGDDAPVHAIDSLETKPL
jgi:stress-induced morphogen